MSHQVQVGPRRRALVETACQGQILVVTCSEAAGSVEAVSGDERDHPDPPQEHQRVSSTTTADAPRVVATRAIAVAVAAFGEEVLVADAHELEDEAESRVRAATGADLASRDEVRVRVRVRARTFV